MYHFLLGPFVSFPLLYVSTVNYLMSVTASDTWKAIGKTKIKPMINSIKQLLIIISKTMFNDIYLALPTDTI